LAKGSESRKTINPWISESELDKGVPETHLRSIDFRLLLEMNHSTEKRKEKKRKEKKRKEKKRKEKKRKKDGRPCINPPKLACGNSCA